MPGGSDPPLDRSFDSLVHRCLAGFGFETLCYTCFAESFRGAVLNRMRVVAILYIYFGVGKSRSPPWSRSAGGGGMLCSQAHGFSGSERLV